MSDSYYNDTENGIDGRRNNNDGVEGSDMVGSYNRPRRPDPQTILYLRGLAFDISYSQQQIEQYLSNDGGDDSNADEPPEFPQSFAAALSAIDEITNEIASLAGDESGSQCIEVLAHIVTPFSKLAARTLLSSCVGYYLHLATHRYGSHVVQTLLELAVSSSMMSSSKKQDQQDLALHEDSPELMNSSSETLPSLLDLIHGIVEELAPHAPQLAIHVCGSHVLRTLLCVLGNVQLITSHKNSTNAGADINSGIETGAILRGKKKNKKKKRKKPDHDDSSAGGSGSTTMKVEYRNAATSRVNPEEFSESLESLAMALLGDNSSGNNEPGELQQLSCHSSAGPLFIVLLKVLTYSTESARTEFDDGTSGKEQSKGDFRLGIAAAEPKFEENSLAHTVAKRLLCIQDGDGDQQEQKYAGDIIYGMSGEPRGSHLLETLLVLSPDSLHAQLLEYGDFTTPESMQAYVEHDVSNFVIQTLLTTIRSKEQAETVLKVVDVVISNGLAVDPTKKRRGILWRAIELAAKYRVGQETLLKSIRLGFASFVNNKANDVNNYDGEDNEKEEGETVKKTKKKPRKKASAVSMQDCIVRLINLQCPSMDSERISLDAAGVRCVYHLLRLTPRLCEDTLEAILESYAADELVRIAKDGLGSRCIMDGILAGPTKTPFFITAVKGLFDKLKGHWVALATDRVGHHTVRRMFYALPKIDDKSKLADELVSGGNRLSGNAMGRSITDLCLLDMYNEDRKGWRQKLSKLMVKDSNFVTTNEATKTTTSTGDDKDEGDIELQTKSKRKRKRKRKGGEALPQDGDGDQPKKQKESSCGGVDSIVDMISHPKE